LILQYIKFYGGNTHPKDMGKNEVERFLSHMAEQKNVKDLDLVLGNGIAPMRSKRKKNLPTVFR